MTELSTAFTPCHTTSYLDYFDLELSSGVLRSVTKKRFMPMELRELSETDFGKR